MDLTSGRPNTQSTDEILDLMIEDAKDLFGDDLNDNETSAIRFFYQPVAQRLVEAQNDIGLVLSNSQIDYASGNSLELLTALVGVRREPATHASGFVTFYRDQPSDSRDFTIPRGTMVRTDGEQSITFETTQTGIINQGETEEVVPVRSVDTGTGYNVGSNTVTEIINKPTGVEGVYNSNPIDGGRNEETDSQLRERAKSELSEGSRATAPALVSACESADDTVRSVSIYTTPEDNLGTIPGFELVVEGGDTNTIAQTIMDHKAAGDKSYSGYYGDPIENPVEVNIGNGQTKEIEFSRPESVYIYIDIQIETRDTYAGDQAVRDSIVEYIGGETSEGVGNTGELQVADDVIHGEIEYAIRSIDGVYDVPVLSIGTSADPTESENITISDGQVAVTEATNEYITIE